MDLYPYFYVVFIVRNSAEILIGVEPVFEELMRKLKNVKWIVESSSDGSDFLHIFR